MITRYRPDTDEECRSFEMIEDKEGDYVAYEDYEELEEENRYLRAGCQDDTHQCPIVGTNNSLIERIAELEAENKRLREALERIAAYDSYHSEWPTEIWINAPPEELAHVILSGGKYPPQQTHVGGKL